jgi:hypothetical protein
LIDAILAIVFMIGVPLSFGLFAYCIISDRKTKRISNHV